MDVPTPTTREYDIPCIEDRILLNVGGVHYSTTLKTLRAIPGTYFDSMFSGNFAIEPEEDGRYFIDRNGKLFMYFLDYMRNGKVRLPSDQTLVQRILLEGEFYGMDLVSLEEKSKQIPVSIPNKNYCSNDKNSEGTASIAHIGGLLYSNCAVYNPVSGDSAWTDDVLKDTRTLSVSQQHCFVNKCGATFTNLSPGDSTGVLVIDLGRAYDLSIFVLFPGTHGNFTDFEISTHFDLTRNADINDLEMWQVVVPWTTKECDPTALQLSSWVAARYLKVELRNSASSYISLGQIKAYSSLSVDVGDIHFTTVHLPDHEEEPCDFSDDY